MKHAYLPMFRLRRARGARLRFAPLLLCVCCLFCAACAGGAGMLPPPSETPVPTAEPTPTPAPTPAPVVAVWSDEISDADGAAAFFEGAASEAAQADGLRTTLVSGGAEALAAYGFTEGSALLCLLSAPEPDYAPLAALAERGVKVLCYARRGQSVPEGLFAVSYSDAGAAEAAMEALLAYPPHDTPVRVLGLFESEAGDAYRVFSEYAAAGKLLVKGSYEQSGAEADSPEAALEAMLKKLYPGMLDAIYAETPALAQSAANLLSSLSRTDAEIFCASAGAPLLSAMRERPALLVYAAGENPWYAGRLCRENAGRLALGLEIEDRAVLYPRGYEAAALPAAWAALADG